MSHSYSDFMGRIGYTSPESFRWIDSFAWEFTYTSRKILPQNELFAKLMRKKMVLTLALHAGTTPWTFVFEEASRGTSYESVVDTARKANGFTWATARLQEQKSFESFDDTGIDLIFLSNATHDVAKNNKVRVFITIMVLDGKIHIYTEKHNLESIRRVATVNQRKEQVAGLLDI